jgi:hypothetical protein
VSVLDELGQALECLVGARQALARAAEQVEDLDWLQYLAQPDRKLRDIQWQMQQLHRQRRKVER